MFPRRLQSRDDASDRDVKNLRGNAFGCDDRRVQGMIQCGCKTRSRPVRFHEDRAPFDEALMLTLAFPHLAERYCTYLVCVY